MIHQASNIQGGFRRLAIVAGAITCVLTGIAILWSREGHQELEWTAFILFLVVTFLIPYGVIRLIGWIFERFGRGNP